MLIDESTLKHDDNATAASDAPTDDGQTRSQNAPTNDGQPTLTLVTDFSGMETPSQALHTLGAGVIRLHVPSPHREWSGPRNENG